MEITLTKIGNSRGFRVPANILKQVSGTARFDIDYDKKRQAIVIKTIMNPREGWAEAAKRLHANGDDVPIIPDNLDIDFGLEAYPCTNLQTLSKNSTST